MSKPLPDRMRIVTNPHFDLEIDPSENEFAYVNPVALNNDLIKLANEMITLAEAKVEAIKAIQKLKLERKKLERALDDLEQQLLRDDPLSPSEAKSLKTIAAAAARRAKESGHLATIDELRAKIRAVEDQIDKHDAIIRTSDIYWDTAERVSENIKTHLSFVKDEKKRAYAY